jgi:superfamily I DNA and/or RNA helicase
MLDSDCDAVAITPYKGQVKEIQKSLPKKYRDRVRTVDGFQGKEADFIILSLVRNNVRTGSSRRWGFFRDPRRINVALSRAREGLAVVTSVQHIVETDWADDEGHLTLFIDAVRKRGKVVDYREAW